MPEKKIKLSEIMKKLSLNISEEKPADVCCLLPDSLDESLCSMAACGQMRRDLFRDLKNFLNGNLRGEDGFYVANGTKDLRKHLQKNDIIIYDDGRPAVRAVDNMLEKLRHLIVNKSLVAEDSLFSTYRNKSFWYGNEDIYNAYERCLKKGSPDALTYALFYLVLASIFHYHTYEFFGFYAEERLDTILGQVITRDTGDGVLADPQYLNCYKVYCSRSNYSDIQYGGTLDLCEKGIGILHLVDDKGSYQRKYTGTPWFNEKERLVYFIGHSEKHRVCILVFRYEPFDNAPMYYRMAFLVTLNRDEKQPEIRKLVICRKDCSEETDMIKGMLRMTNGSFTVRPDDMDGFLQEILQFDWFVRNEEAFRKYLSTKSETLYNLNEFEIYNNGSLVMKDKEKMKMIKMLVSRSMTERYISLKDLPNIHKLMRDSEDATGDI